MIRIIFPILLLFGCESSRFSRVEYFHGHEGSNNYSSYSQLTSGISKNIDPVDLEMGFGGQYDSLQGEIYPLIGVGGYIEVGDWSFFLSGDMVFRRSIESISYTSIEFRW